MSIVIIIFLLGMAVGSFLNVLIDRIPLGESVIGGRSYCDSCKHKLALYDLIPLLSWIWLRGKCRYCNAEISWQYPIVELMTGLLFLLPIILFGQEEHTFVSNSCYLNAECLGEILFIWGILAALFVIFVTDLKKYIIPDKVLFPAFLVALTYRIAHAYFDSSSGISLSLENFKGSTFSLGNPLLSSIGAALFFLALVLITRGKGMGMGDVKYALLMGLLLGYPGIIIGLYVAFLTGALVSVILILLGKKKFGQNIPFGPFLVVGTLVGMFWGERILEIFWNLY